MNIFALVFNSVVEYYKIDLVKHGLRLLYIWTWVARKINIMIDFILCLLMCLPESLIIVNKPVIVNPAQQKIKVINAITESNQIITNKLNLFLMRHYSADEKNFNFNKLREFLDITMLLVTYLIMSDGDNTNEINRIKTTIIELKDKVVYQNNAEAAFGDVTL